MFPPVAEGRSRNFQSFGTTKHLLYKMLSNIRYVVLMINNVGLGFALPNIINHEHNISNVGLHLVQQMHNVGPS